MKQPVRKKVAEANNIDQTKWVYTVVFDMNNIMKIAAVKILVNELGENYGAVVNAIGMVGEVLRKKDFDYCVACWDGDGGGTLRYQVYNDYKANRNKHYELYDISTEYNKAISEYVQKVFKYSRSKKHKHEFKLGESDENALLRQKGIVQEIFEELCVRQYQFDYVEGDDLISYYVHRKKPNEKVVIVSTDRDLMQLISDTVAIYNPREKRWITKENAIEELGFTHENVVLSKILCGDSSDNIKGVKGLGVATMLKLFPKIKTEKVELGAVIARSKEILEERRLAKKKPLKVLENIVNGVTDGCQGDKLYETNEKIIDLSEPMLTDKAKKTLDDQIYTVMNTTDRDAKNIYNILRDRHIYDLLDEERFGRMFGPFSRIIAMENKRYKDSVNKN